MAKNQLFNIMTTGPAVPGPDQGGAVGVITTGQSAITFAGAPAAVTLVWKVIGALSATLATSKLLPVALAIAIGMLIYWQTASAGSTAKDKIIGFLLALINSFAIAAATLGIESVRT